MQFAYEITADDYVAGQRLYWKLTHGRKLFVRAAGWIVLGCLFMLVAWNEETSTVAPILLAGVGLCLIYCGFVILLPQRHFRKHYANSFLKGRKFHAVVTEQGFEAKDESWACSVQWQGVQLKGESANMFAFTSFGTIFMFGKKYLTDEQQQKLRMLAKL